MRDVEELYINLSPIQAAGRLTSEAMKAMIAYGDGYSVCDFCKGRLDQIKKPPIAQFHEDLAKFVNMDVARVYPGARRCFQAVVSSLCKPGDTVVVSSLAHYTQFLAIEHAGAKAVEIPATNNITTAEAAHETLENLKKEGVTPSLLMIEHFDYSYANEHDVAGITHAAHQHSVPVLYNGAYTVGVMPVDGKKLGVDFVVGSGHKSMASPAPTGVLAVSNEYADKVFKTSDIEGDITHRKFKNKELEALGCTVMGAPIIGMMASLPIVSERIKKWSDEIRHSNYLIEKLLSIPGTQVLSEMPRKHTLTRMDTTKSFDNIVETHKRKGFFLMEELKERGIVGVIPGATKVWKLNCYGLTDEQIRCTADAFIDIAKKYKLL